MRFLMILCTCVCFIVCARDEGWEKLHSAAKEYTSAKDGENEDLSKKWNKKFKGRVEQRAEDSKLSFDAAAQSVALDWMNDHEKGIRAKQEKDLIEISRIFCWLYDNYIGLPPIVREQLNEEDKIEKFANYLTDQIEKK